MVKQPMSLTVTSVTDSLPYVLSDKYKRYPVETTVYTYSEY